MGTGARKEREAASVRGTFVERRVQSQEGEVRKGHERVYARNHWHFPVGVSASPESRTNTSYVGQPALTISSYFAPFALALRSSLVGGGGGGGGGPNPPFFFAETRTHRRGATLRAGATAIAGADIARDMPSRPREISHTN